MATTRKKYLAVRANGNTGAYYVERAQRDWQSSTADTLGAFDSKSRAEQACALGNRADAENWSDVQLQLALSEM